MSDLHSTDNAPDNQYGSVIVAGCTGSRALCIDNSNIGRCVCSDTRKLDKTVAVCRSAVSVNAMVVTVQ